ncbi:MAG: phenylalanine--tRNA ligase subunit alpha [Candidatus Neomarinimicrobiota bacterium]|jgi:phenylalanyl-tRNA synthetase alpha chain|nr:phenylalanine--tRNA ligase subunit alpha [Candidatus Neomarinimicrobiota bacterium]MDX9779452.1 phenylalanine--tRNA ligase subunit alpha [bacterium]
MNKATISEIRKQFDKTLEEVHDAAALEALKYRYLGRKGKIADLFSRIRDLSSESRKEAGELLNRLKADLSAAIDARTAAFSAPREQRSYIDYSMPGYAMHRGSRHPLTQAVDDMLNIFQRLGFDIAYGPEVETDWFNFESLNFPPDHPARDMQDTFYTEGGGVLRTHTSPVQTRYMSTHEPPLRIVAPGRVFRNEAISARSYCLFHQIEGLYVDEGITFADLKGTIERFCRLYYGKDVKIKFRGSYFPFTEPSAEIDVSCFLCGGKGCPVCKQSGWLEIMGCGMVDPNVLKAVNYDTERFSGYAFGLGIERMLMMRLGINDIRILFENDVEFLKQF